MIKEDIKARTKNLAILIFKFIEKLPKSKSVDVIFYQLLKSSSSVAANYRAACRAKSNQDFLNKLKIVNEESDETLFLLKFIKDLDIYQNHEELKQLINESNELTAIFSPSIKTITSKNKS